MYKMDVAPNIIIFHADGHPWTGDKSYETAIIYTRYQDLYLKDGWSIWLEGNDGKGTTAIYRRKGDNKNGN